MEIEHGADSKQLRAFPVRVLDRRVIIPVLKLLLGLVRDLFRSRASLESEVVALRQQIALLQQRLGTWRVQLTRNDRMFWVLLSRFWPGWRSALAIVQPDTVLRWHRVGFRLYWRRIGVGA